MPVLKYDLNGKSFGFLTVIHYLKRSCWLCECVCGNRKSYQAVNLVLGKVRSCGCKRRELVLPKISTHGLRNHPLYPIWAAMKSRCLNKSNKNYASYGGRGITVSLEWLNCANFIDDMSGAWKKGLWLDRIDNDKGYCKENCRWVPPLISRHNQRGRGTSVFKGVHYNRRTHLWRAVIVIDKRKKQLGEFDNEIEAALAYNKAALEIYGEFASLNDVGGYYNS